MRKYAAIAVAAVLASFTVHAQQVTSQCRVEFLMAGDMNDEDVVPEMPQNIQRCLKSVIVEEVRNGVPVRMAVLARALGKAS